MTNLAKVKRILKVNFFYLLISFFNASKAVLLLPLYVSLLSVSQYGILALMNTSLSFFTIFVALNLGLSVQTYYFDYAEDEVRLKEYIQRVFTLSLLVSAIVILACIFLGPAIFDFVFKDEEIQFYPNGLIVVLTASFVAINNIHYVLLRNKESLKAYALLTVFWVVSSTILQILFLYFLEWGVSGVLLGALIPSAAVFFYILWTSPYFRFRFDLVGIKSSVYYSLWMLPYLLIQWFLAKGDRVIVENHIGLSQVGVYAFLMNISMIISLVATSILTSIRPTLFKQFKLMKGAVIKDVKLLFLYYVLLVIATSLVIYLGIGFLHLFNISTEYLEVKNFVILALILFVIRAIIRFFNEYLAYYKRSKEMSLFSVFGVIVFFALLRIYLDELSLNELLNILIITNLLTLVFIVIRSIYLLRMQKSLEG